jgi:hypothetical protein
MKTPPTLRRVQRTVERDTLARVLTTVERGVHGSAISAAPPIAFGLRDHHGDRFDLDATVLDPDEPITSLIGFTCPEPWLAFGVLTPGRARPLDADDHLPGHRRGQEVHVGLIVSRTGEQVTLLRRGEAPAELTPGPPAEGRLPDACRRCLGLATAPPPGPATALRTLLWLEAVLAECLAEPGRLRWDEAVRLHPHVSHLLGLDPGFASELPERFTELVSIVDGRTDASEWGELRRQVISGAHSDLGVSAAGAAWMDDGMFSREVLGCFPPIAGLLTELEPVASPGLVGEVRAALETWGAG